MKPISRPSLGDLAIVHGTDKSPLQHNYTPYYSMFFEPYRDDKLNILEIGVDGGSSIKMWAEYFPNAQIVGADIREGYEYLHEFCPRIKTILLDQSNEADLALFGIQNEDLFDFIIVDGSHEADHDLLTYNTLFPYLKPGGYFAVEDALCSFDLARWGKNGNIWDRVKQCVDDVNMGGKISVDHLCSNKKTEAHKYSLDYYERWTEWVFVSTGLFIVKKMNA